jgi:ATP-dependent Clp protease protease subunit
MNYFPKDKEFERYAKSEFNVGSSSLDLYGNKAAEKHASMTPYILEERKMNVAQMDVFSRLMADRLLWVAGPVNDAMSTVVQAQLMFLSSNSNEDIIMHIDSPGGSVKSGLSMVDVMEYIPCDIRTVNTGIAASMGSVLLGAGTKGKRSSLRHSTTMLHQSSGGFSGNIQDAEVDWDEWQKINLELFNLLGSYCGKKADKVMKDATRNFWLNAEEAVAYGIIDEIIKPKKNI